jgi:transposase-like protein
VAKKHGREFWAGLSAEVDAGRSVDAVSKRHGVRPKTLSWWRWKLSQGATRTFRKSRKNALLPVVVTDGDVARGGELLEVAVDDVRIRLECGTDVAYVARLINALRRSC